jgi:type VI protein secretion system component VasK
LRQHKGRVAQPEEGFDHIAPGGEEEGPKQDQQEAESQRAQRNALLEFSRECDDNSEFLTNLIFESNVDPREAWLGSSEAGA